MAVPGADSAKAPVYRPILFSGPMVRAILEGRKTQTRRVLAKQPLDILPMKGKLKGIEWIALLQRKPEPLGTMFRCRLGAPGDRVWVRETWAYVSKHEYPSSDCDVEYRADLPVGCTDQPGHWPADEARGDPEAPKWRPSIFMPRAASRITLEIVSVRCERLKDISERDALAEGCIGDGKVTITAKSAYKLLWDSINAKRGYGWDKNPWVWAIEFKRV